MPDLRAVMVLLLSYIIKTVRLDYSAFLTIITYDMVVLGHFVQILYSHML